MRNKWDVGYQRREIPRAKARTKVRTRVKPKPYMNAHDAVEDLLLDSVHAIVLDPLREELVEEEWWEDE